MRRPAVLLCVQVAAVTAILGCVLAIAALHPRRLDLTPERRFTLSPWTREVLGRLAGDVRITLFYSSQAAAPQATKATPRRARPAYPATTGATAKGWRA